MVMDVDVDMDMDVNMDMDMDMVDSRMCSEEKEAVEEERKKRTNIAANDATD